MARRVRSVAELARSVGLDVDEVLIRLWDAGLDHYAEPGDKLRRRDLDSAHQAAGLATKREMLDPDYWAKRLGIDSPSLRTLLAELGTPMSTRARVLPRGALAKLSRYAADRTRPAEPAAVTEALPKTPPPRFPPLEWRSIGHAREVRFLDEAEVEAMHWELVRDFAEDDDPIDPPGVRDSTLLASAVFRQHTALQGERKYPTVEMVAAALFHALVHDHPFHNGNKRTALVAMLVFLDENGLMVRDSCDEEELFKLVVRLAQHQLVPRGSDLPDREVLALAEWIRERVRAVEKGERPLQWRRLRQILDDLGCVCDTSGVSNRINVTRVIEEPGLLRTRRRQLSSQVKYTDDGRQAQVHAIKKIRSDLWLDDAHGVDSAAFYGRVGPSPAGFIVKYRKTLKRLARL